MSIVTNENKRNCQSIDISLLNPLLRGLKVAGIGEIETNAECSGIDIRLDNKSGDRIHLFIEPVTDTKNNVKLIVSIGRPV